MTRRTAMGLVALALASPLTAFAQTGDLRAQLEKCRRRMGKAFNAGDAAGGAKYAWTAADVVGVGDQAVETGKWVATSADGKHLDHGPYMTLYKKEGGAWKLHRDIWNSAMSQK